jgi:endo-1,4-beta-xylanase
MTPRSPRLRPRRSRFGALAAGLAVTVAGASLLAMVAASSAQAATSLRTLAEGQGRYFGTALTVSDLSNTGETTISNAQFDMVTPANEMKWDTTEPSSGRFNFGPGDQIASYAKSHNMRVRGHNLVWQGQLPSWVSNLPSNQVQAAMDAHITAEVNHYKGQIYAWDVVNEPFNGDGSFVNDAFYRAMGSNYFAEALRTAHAADPDAKLYINDYNIEGQNAKSNAMYNLAKTLLSQGVPLGGIGFESHFIVGQVPSDLKANMQRFSDLGLDVAVTELDDRMQLPASSAGLQQQATDYSNITKDCLAVARCVGISQWGVDDANSWIDGTFPGYGAATMYDRNFQPKAAYYSTVTALGGTSTTTTPPPPSGSGALHAVGAGKCLEVPNSSTTAGTQVDIRDCNGGANQSWTRTSSGQLTVYSGSSQMCLDAYNNQTTAGTKVVTWSCNGGTNQQWNINSNGTVTSAQSGLCLDVTGASTANGALAELWTCNGGSNQQWTLS